MPVFQDRTPVGDSLEATTHWCSHSLSASSILSKIKRKKVLVNMYDSHDLSNGFIMLFLASYLTKFLAILLFVPHDFLYCKIYLSPHKWEYFTSTWLHISSPLNLRYSLFYLPEKVIFVLHTCTQTCSSLQCLISPYTKTQEHVSILLYYANYHT